MPDLTTSERLHLWTRMVLIREVETRLGELFAAGQVPGFIHLSIGQEAVAAGVARALRPGDTYATTHRGHGHALANGVDLLRFLLEILGREGGLCKGRAGSMHVTDVSIGMLGANGIVGAGVPIALGSALAHAQCRRPNVAVAFFGDGAMAEGVMHESVNIAKLWNLPILFVCENNGWSEFSPTSRMLATTPLAWAKAFDLPAESVDGNDVEAVLDVAETAIALCRDGHGPRLLDCRTHRHRGHFEGDPQRYRSADELATLAGHDPLARYRGKLRGAGIADADLEAIVTSTRTRIQLAVDEALAAPSPSLQAVHAEVYGPVAHA